jgi:hypothetical protein
MELFKRHKTILLHSEKSVDSIGLDVRILRMPTSKNQTLNIYSKQYMNIHSYTNK